MRSSSGRALLEKESILHELEEKMKKAEMNNNSNARAVIPTSGHETWPQLTSKINEAQAQREALRQTLGSADRCGRKSYSVATTEKVCDTRGTITGDVS